MGYPIWRPFSLSCSIGLMIGSSLFSFSLVPSEAQAAEFDGQRSRTGVIQNCKGQMVELSSSQLTNTNLKTLTSCSSRAIPQLLEALKSEDWKVKAIASYALGLLGTKAQPAIPALDTLIQDENPDVRFAATQALGMIGTEAVVPALTKALQDKDENVRVSAAVAFQKIGSVAKQAKPVLIGALWDGNWFVRSRVAKTVAKLGLETDDIPEVVKPLRNDFFRYGDDRTYQDGTIVALMLSIYPPIFNKLENLPQFFIEGLKSSKPEVRESSAFALGGLSLTRPGYDRLREIVYALQAASKDSDPRVRARVLKTLSDILQDFREEESSSFAREVSFIETLLVKSLNDKELSVRRIAFDALNKVKISSPSNLSATMITALEAVQSENDTDIRQSAFSLLDSNQLNENLPPLLKFKLANKIPQILANSLYDKDENVRRNAVRNSSVSTLIRILNNKDKVVDAEMRHVISTDIALDKISFSQDSSDSQIVFELLKEALKDSDIRIRVNAAHILERSSILNEKDAVSIFIDGLKSDIPEAKLHAVFALHKMCMRGNDVSTRCEEAKIALPLLIEMLKSNIKPLRYAAALAITDFDFKEDSAVDALGEILLEETDYELRDNTISALRRIDSQKSLLVMTQFQGFEDKQSRYQRDCNFGSGMYTGQSSYRESVSLLLDALKVADVRFSASESFSLYRHENTTFSEVQGAVSELALILEKYNAYTNHPLLKNVFKLKNQDIRRSAIYALGQIGGSLKGNDEFSDQRSNLYPDIQIQIIAILKNILTDQEESLDIRWMAAASLQKLDINVDSFFLKKKLVNPAIAIVQSRRVGSAELAKISEYSGYSFIPRYPRYEYVKPEAIKLQLRYLLRQYGFIPGRGGIDGLNYDIYSMQYVDDSRLGCGAGLGEVFNTLQKLFNRSPK